MPSDPYSFFKACLGNCFPWQPSQPDSPVRRADHYNARLRANLGVPEQGPEHHPYEPQPAIGLGITTAPDQPRLKKVRFQTTEPKNWATSNMNREELKELFNLIHETLEHIPYAICGLGALIDHGFPDRKASKISIVCPQECSHNVRAWMATRGYAMDPSSNAVGLPMRDGATVRRVRIKYLERGFEKLERVRSSFSNATVLSVASQLDQVAAGYLDNRRRGDEHALRIVASDVFVFLNIIAARHRKVDPKLLPTFLGEDFFADFTARHVEARPEMARAGIDVAAVLKKHNAAAALREHDKMLLQYGMRGDVPAREKGQFEGIRDLKDRKSVYTLREREREPDSRVKDVPAPTTAPTSVDRPAPRRPARSYLRVDGKSTDLPGLENRILNQKGATPGGPGRSLTVPSVKQEQEQQPRPVEKPGHDWI
ncbi:hypothetical protein F5B17DRAFT_454550 [Nemania serpens]|nr:hypothetical protein F5B17DRAFT_454550 [Nemania serpens]